MLEQGSLEWWRQLAIDYADVSRRMADEVKRQQAIIAGLTAACEAALSLICPPPFGSQYRDQHYIVYDYVRAAIDKARDIEQEAP